MISTGEFRRLRSAADNRTISEMFPTVSFWPVSDGRTPVLGLPSMGLSQAINSLTLRPPDFPSGAALQSPTHKRDYGFISPAFITDIERTLIDLIVLFFA